MKSSDDRYGSLVGELFRKHPSVQTAGFGSGAYKPGLDGMRRFASSLGNPENGFRSIHVAGTNGKGSVSSMLASNLAASGLRVGLYTSPHLVDFRERIKTVSGTSFSLIPREEVLEFLESVGTEGLSFFEITTGMAFRWFARQKVDVAVIEVGLGGRLDSTNIIVPELSVVTGIGLDHCAMLGNTRAEIAAEKAGIFKTGVPALVASRDDETGPVFENAAASVHCPLFFADEEYPCPLPEGLVSSLDLNGPCQKMNVRTVLAALSLLGAAPDYEALKHTALVTGLRGRWERLHSDPEVICDIGHNPQALELNFRRLEESGRPLVIVYGVMADKDLDGISEFMPSGAEYVLAAPDTERALPVEKLAVRLSGLRPDLHTRVSSSVSDAVEQALSLAASMDNPLVYIGGSTFVVSEAIGKFAIFAGV